MEEYCIFPVRIEGSMKRRRSVFILFSILFTMSLFVGICLLIRFAEVASGSVTISPKLIRQKIVSKSSGSLRMIKSDASKVAVGDVIAYISNSIELADIQNIDSLFEDIEAGIAENEFKNTNLFAYNLGFLEPYLSTFHEAQQNLINFNRSQTNRNRIDAHRNTISRNKNEHDILLRKLSLLEEQLVVQKSLLHKYEALFADQLIEEQQVLTISKQLAQLQSDLNTFSLRKIQLLNKSGELWDDIMIIDSEQTDMQAR